MDIEILLKGILHGDSEHQEWLKEAVYAVVTALVKFTLNEADVNAVDDGIADDVAGVQSKDVLPLTTRVTSNVFPPLLK